MSDLATLARLNLPEIFQLVNAGEEAHQKLYKITHLLIGRLKQAEEDEDGAGKRLCQLLACACALHLHTDEPDAPFGPASEYIGNLLFTSGRIVPEDIATLIVLRDALEIPAIQARVADILWVFSRDFASGKAAVQHYLSVAATCGEENWLEATDHWSRAVNVALGLGKRAEERPLVATVLEAALTNPFYGRHWAAVKLMELLLDLGQGNAQLYTDLAEQYATDMVALSNWRFARRYYEVAARWQGKAGNPDEIQRLKALAAETWVQEADTAEADRRGAMVTATLLETAIQELRGLPRTRERVRSLRHRMLDLQERSIDELKTHEYPIPRDRVEANRAAILAHMSVSSGDLNATLLRLGDIVTEASVQDLRTQVEEALTAPSIVNLITRRLINGNGRQVASIATNHAERVTERMFELQHQLRQFSAFLKIETARQCLLDAFSLRREDLFFLVEGNPVVPPDNRHSLLIGLYAGLQGNFLTASYLLTPQIETLLRRILEIRDGITSGLDPDGVQDTYGINQLLKREEFTSVLERVLGEDLLFELRGLLTERTGLNFRNELTHGLAGDGVAHHHGLLVWHAVLRIVTLPLQLGDSEGTEESVEN